MVGTTFIILRTARDVFSADPHGCMHADTLMPGAPRCCAQCMITVAHARAARHSPRLQESPISLLLSCRSAAAAPCCRDTTGTRVSKTANPMSTATLAAARETLICTLYMIIHTLRIIQRQMHRVGQNSSSFNYPGTTHSPLLVSARQRCYRRVEQEA